LEHILRSQQGAGELQCRKHPSGFSQEDGSVQGGSAGKRKGTAGRSGGSNDAGAHPEERGNPEVQGGTDSGAEQGPGADGPPRRRSQQGLPLRSTAGVSGSDLCPTNPPNPGKVFPHHEGFIQGNPQDFAATWDSQVDTRSGSTRIANCHPLQDDSRGRVGCGCSDRC
jgi:hypothetical protein